MLTAGAKKKLLTRVRSACLAYPESSERESHGAPAFFVREKGCFCMVLDNHHGDGRLALWLPAPPGAQADAVELDPEIFFVPPYVGPSGWIGLRLDRDPPWRWIERAVRDAYLKRAPKKLIASLPPLGGR